jgi:hypothetical protein
MLPYRVDLDQFDGDATSIIKAALERSSIMIYSRCSESGSLAEGKEQ